MSLYNNNVNEKSGWVKKGKNFLVDVSIGACDKIVNDIKEDSYKEAIELGITNTIMALYSADVSDKDIIRVVNEIWRIDVEEIEERLIYEKRQCVIRNFRKYLKLQGYNNDELDKYIKNNEVSIKIKKNPELLKLKNKPEEVKKIIEKM